VRSTRYTPRPRESAFVAKENNNAGSGRASVCSTSEKEKDVLKIIILIFCVLISNKVFVFFSRVVSPFARALRECEGVCVCDG